MGGHFFGTPLYTRANRRIIVFDASSLVSRHSLYYEFCTGNKNCSLIIGNVISQQFNKKFPNRMAPHKKFDELCPRMHCFCLCLLHTSTKLNVWYYITLASASKFRHRNIRNQKTEHVFSRQNYTIYFSTTSVNPISFKTDK